MGDPVQNLTDNLDDLDLGRVGDKALEGAAWGVKIGSTAGAVIGAAVGPPLGPLFPAAGVYYGAILGAGAGVMNALFSKDPAVFRREQAKAAEIQANANIALNHMFATWPPAARDVFVKTPMYQSLVATAKSPDKYTDPLAIYDAHPEIRDYLRERIRLATVDTAHPQGIIYGDAMIKAQIGDRLAALQKAEDTRRVELGAGIATGLAALGGGLAIWWKRRKEAQRAKEGMR